MMIDVIRAPGGADIRRPGRAGGSFEAKIVWLCLMATVAAMGSAFAVFQWQGWCSDRADLVADQTALARMITPQLTLGLQRGDAALVDIARGMVRGREQTTGAAWFPASGGRIQLLAPEAGAPPLRPTAGVLASAVSNALKFTREGEVRLRVEALASEAGPLLKISVSDTGVGIAPDVLSKVFERFVQGYATATRRFGGAGLGLTISRHFVELMGGEIEARSEAGRGATFEVRLPLIRLAAAEPAAVAVERAA